jgi:hypothetical protein
MGMQLGNLIFRQYPPTTLLTVSQVSIPVVTQPSLQPARRMQINQ